MDPSSDATPGDPRPPDEWILDQQNAIRDESSARPYVGPLEDLDKLAEEYQEATVFHSKIARLKDEYGRFRRVRGDGNCLYRGFLFSHLEHLLNNRDASNNFLGELGGMTARLSDAGYQELVFEDSLDLLVTTVKDMHANNGKVDLDVLLFNLNDDMLSNLLVMLMRMISGAEIKGRDQGSFFLPFIMGSYDDCMTVDGFVSRYVEPMGEEADHIQIQALTDALKVAVKVVYLDRSGGDGDSADVYSFIPESLPPGTEPKVVLLYRPGHYDILYR